MSARPRRRLRPVPITAAYTPAERGYVAEVLEAKSVYTEGGTLEEARANLINVIAVMLEEAPHQFGRRRARIPPGALTEKLFILLPA